MSRAQSATLDYVTELLNTTWDILTEPARKRLRLHRLMESPLETKTVDLFLTLKERHGANPDSSLYTEMIVIDEAVVHAVEKFPSGWLRLTLTSQEAYKEAEAAGRDVAFNRQFVLYCENPQWNIRSNRNWLKAETLKRGNAVKIAFYYSDKPLSPDYLVYNIENAAAQGNRIA